MPMATRYRSSTFVPLTMMTRHGRPGLSGFWLHFRLSQPSPVPLSSSGAKPITSIENAFAEPGRSNTGTLGIDPAGRLLAMKADVSVLEIWDELSRILPDHTFVTESRIADGKVMLSGFSADAARLVRIIDQSPLFSGAALTAAITPDANEHKDRFGISFKVSGARPAKSARNASR